MRARLVLENVGHPMSKVVDMAEVPMVGDVLPMGGGRTRAVSTVDQETERDEHRVELVEDGADLALYTDPAAHIARIGRMKASEWEIENEQTLRVWLQDRISR